MATASHASKGDCWRLDCWLRPRRTPRAKGDCWQPDCLVLPRGLPRAQEDCWFQPRVQFKFNFQRGESALPQLAVGPLSFLPLPSRFCRSWPSGRCRFCRSPWAVGEPISAFGPQLVCRSPRFVGLPLPACRCRRSGRSRLAAVGLPQSACRARKFIFEIVYCLRCNAAFIIKQGQPRPPS